MSILFLPFEAIVITFYPQFDIIRGQLTETEKSSHLGVQKPCSTGLQIEHEKC